ncbi:probable carboxylesterase 2 [Euphorbia lathyris]|uniref:probable carboxylesterase 2 n=1 Tax=Euphorbia lathyris TaxID=212925 RepID=UPI0033141079
MSQKQVIKDVFPYLKIYDDGTIERYAGTEFTPAGLDSQTSVLSKDIIISTSTTLSARIYRPQNIPNHQKLPLLFYFHGGAFCIASAAEPLYHHCLNHLVSQAKAIAVSVNYRLAPENPLPAAYEDSFAAFRCLSKPGEGTDPWINDYADFDRIFIAGDSAGANIAHHLGFRVKDSESDSGSEVKIRGIVMIHPYFWGKDPIGIERNDGVRKAIVDNWWMLVCPSDKGCDDPYINLFVDGAPSLMGLGCENVVVYVAEKDILCDRGKVYQENLMKSGWKGKAEIMETKGEDHVFHLFKADCENAHVLIKHWASYISNL